MSEPASKKRKVEQTTCGSCKGGNSSKHTHLCCKCVIVYCETCVSHLNKQVSASGHIIRCVGCGEENVIDPSIISNCYTILKAILGNNTYSEILKYVIEKTDDILNTKSETIDLFILKDIYVVMKFNKVIIDMNLYDSIETILLERGVFHIHNIAMMYLNCDVKNKSAIESNRLVRLAANKGYSLSENKMGMLYYCGCSECSVAINFKEAMRWFKLSILQGCDKSQYMIGFMYYYGQGVMIDFKEAMKWFTLSARQGYSMAESFMGKMYLTGNGMRKDIKQSIELYKLSYKHGWSAASYDLGNMYYSGKYVVKSMKEAIKYYKLSAEKGHIESLVILGRIYKNGDGVVEIDLFEALKWYCMAWEEGNDDVKVIILDIIENNSIKEISNSEWELMIKDEYLNEEDGYAMLKDIDLCGSEYEFFMQGSISTSHIWYISGVITGIGNGYVYSIGNYYYGINHLDYKKGYKYHLLAANIRNDSDEYEFPEQDPEAFGELGNMYRYGHYVSKDVEKAIKYYTYYLQNTQCSTYPQNIKEMEESVDNLEDLKKLLRLEATKSE